MTYHFYSKSCHPSEAQSLAFDDPVAAITAAAAEAQKTTQKQGADAKTSVTGYLEKRRAPMIASSRGQRQPEFAEDGVTPRLASGVSARSHALVYLLSNDDFYHESDRVKSYAQRSKGKLVAARAFAEIKMLRGMGWRVITV